MNTYGEHLKITIFGQSHAPAIGVVIDGFPAGFAVDMEALQRFLSRRAPSGAAYSTKRKEADIPEFVAGLVNGKTCGAPITAIIRNTDARSADYDAMKDVPRRRMLILRRIPSLAGTTISRAVVSFPAG